MLRIKCSDGAITELFKQFDVDNSGSFQLEELMKIVKTVEAPEAEAEKPVLSMRPQAVAFRSLKFGYHLVMTDTMQTVLYVAFVMVVQVRAGLANAAAEREPRALSANESSPRMLRAHRSYLPLLPRCRCLSSSCERRRSTTSTSRSMTC